MSYSAKALSLYKKLSEIAYQVETAKFETEHIYRLRLEGIELVKQLEKECQDQAVRGFWHGCEFDWERAISGLDASTTIADTHEQMVYCASLKRNLPMFKALNKLDK